MTPESALQPLQERLVLERQSLLSQIRAARRSATLTGEIQKGDVTEAYEQDRAVSLAVGCGKRWTRWNAPSRRSRTGRTDAATCAAWTSRWNGCRSCPRRRCASNARSSTPRLHIREGAIEQQSLVLGYVDTTDLVATALGRTEGGTIPGEVVAALAARQQVGRYRSCWRGTAHAWVTQLTGPFGGERLNMGKFRLPVVPVSEADWVDQNSAARPDLVDQDSYDIERIAGKLKRAAPRADEADLLDQWTIARRQMRS